MLNRERSIKIFGDQLIDKVKDNSACKLTDLKVVLGSNQRKELHPTSSTTCIDVIEQDIVAIVPKEIHLVDTDLTILEGTVLSVYMLSFTIKHSCTEFSAFIKAGSGFYCCPSCNVVVP